MDHSNNLVSCGNLWYLIHCKARNEQYASESLTNLLGLEVFFPEQQIYSRGVMRRLPFFPRYIFAQADLQKVPLGQINGCPGVLRLVGFNGEPQPVSHHIIEGIRNRLDILNKVNHSYFSLGDRVHVHDGPLQGLEMIFLGPATPSKRVHVLLHFLGTLQETQVEAARLAKISGESNTLSDWTKYRRRYTRGKGRRISSS